MKPRAEGGVCSERGCDRPTEARGLCSKHYQRTRAPKISEYDLHRQFAAFLRHALAGNAMFFHVPNGGKRSAAEGGRFKAMAVIPGIPDLVIVDDGRAYFLEIKAQTGRLSDNQIACHKALGRAGCPVAVVRNLEEVIEALQSWGVPLRLAASCSAS